MENIELENKNPIQVVDRVFNIVEIMSSTGPIGLLELSNLANLHKSTTHRLLNSLIYMNYVKQNKDTGKYSLTFKLLEIANKSLNQSDILQTTHEYLKKLSMETGETVHLVEEDGINAVYIDKVESSVNSVRLVSKVGSKIPLYCSGVGKALLALKSNDEVTEIWRKSDIHKLTPYTITSLDALLEKLDEVRKNGYALDDEENEEGVRCIAACIPDFTGKAKYAFSLSAPKQRLSDDKIESLAPFVLSLKKELSKEFGYKYK